MEWIIAYLVSVIVVPTFVGLLVFTRYSGNKVELEQEADVIQFAAVIVFWPISFSVWTYCSLRKKYISSLKEQAENLVTANRLNDTIDRSGAVSASEDHLKLILRAYRKKCVDLKPIQVENIREELLRRNMERNLLK